MCHHFLSRPRSLEQQSARPAVAHVQTPRDAACVRVVLLRLLPHLSVVPVLTKSIRNANRIYIATWITYAASESMCARVYIWILYVCVHARVRVHMSMRLRLLT